MSKINCWLCRNVLEIGEGIGYYFDQDLNIRCERCELPISPATEEAEAELQRFTEPSLKSSYTHVNNTVYPQQQDYHHGHGAGGHGGMSNIPQADDNTLMKRHPFHKNGQFGPLGEEWSGYDGGGDG